MRSGEMDEVLQFIDNEISRAKGDIDNWTSKINDHKRDIDEWKQLVLDAEQKMSNLKVAREKVDS